MDLRINQKATALSARRNSFLRWTRNVLLVFGVMALSYAGFTLLNAKLYQAYLTWQFQRALNGVAGPISSAESSDAPTPLTALTETDHASPESPGADVREGAPLGRIEIGRIGLAAMILEGTDEATLHLAVGHIPGTPLPGQDGNVALAGHRDTFFRALRNIRQDDEITLTTLTGSYRYQVDSTRVVEPEEIEVLDNGSGDILTLVTCYPFSFVGSAPRRFIVRARRAPA